MHTQPGEESVYWDLKKRRRNLLQEQTDTGIQKVNILRDMQVNSLLERSGLTTSIVRSKLHFSEDEVVS